MTVKKEDQHPKIRQVQRGGGFYTQDRKRKKKIGKIKLEDDREQELSESKSAIPNQNEKRNAPSREDCYQTKGKDPIIEERGGCMYKELYLLAKKRLRKKRDQLADNESYPVKVASAMEGKVGERRKRRL